MSNSALKNKAVAQYRALMIEKDPDQMRIWISKLNKLGVDVLASLDMADAKNKLLLTDKYSINFIIANRNLLALDNNDKSVYDFIDFVESLEYQPLLIFYPIAEKAVEKYQKKIFAQLDLPVNDKNLFALLNKIKTNPAQHSQALSRQHPLISVLSPFLVFRSKLMLDGLALLPHIAKTDYSVLITGQTGTGKEMVAKAVHFLSARNQGSFVTVNCGAIPETLIESELFGHEKGAFTGALQKRVGKFEEASNGTLFLDEIGEMPLNMQVRLLRALEDKAITPLGSNKVIHTNPRIIAATQVDLADAVKKGKFRDDLYYRLNVLYVHLPPLSQRKEDIELLLVHFLNTAFSQIGIKQPYPYLSVEALQILKDYHWPGNVRELKNIAIRIASTFPADGEIISASFVENFIPQPSVDLIDVANFSNQAGKNGVFIPWGLSMQQAKDMIIKHVLHNTDNNVTKAAKILKISTRNLSRIVKRFKDK